MKITNYGWSTRLRQSHPTRVRSRGTGLAAGASKAGGVLIIALVVAAVTSPSIATMALLGALPMTLAVLAVGLFGVETNAAWRRSLPRICTCRPYQLPDGEGRGHSAQCAGNSIKAAGWFITPRSPDPYSSQTGTRCRPSASRAASTSSWMSAVLARVYASPEPRSRDSRCFSSP